MSFLAGPFNYYDGGHKQYANELTYELGMPLLTAEALFAVTILATMVLMKDPRQIGGVFLFGFVLHLFLVSFHSMDTSNEGRYY